MELQEIFIISVIVTVLYIVVSSFVLSGNETKLIDSIIYRDVDDEETDDDAIYEMEDMKHRYSAIRLRSALIRGAIIGIGTFFIIHHLHPPVQLGGMQMAGAAWMIPASDARPQFATNPDSFFQTIPQF